MGCFSKKDLLTDDVIKSEYYDEYVDQIKSNAEFQRMACIADKSDLQIVFGFAKGKYGFTIQYDIGFEICDVTGNTISVPATSRFYDLLFNLVSYFPVAAYNMFKKKRFVFELDQKELTEDCKLFSDFLSEQHMINP